MTMRELLSELRKSFKEPGNWAYYANQVEGTIANATAYGEANTKATRSLALKFNLSRREFADLLNTHFLAEAHSRRGSSRGILIAICGSCTHLEHEMYMRQAVDEEGEQVKICSVCATERYFHCGFCGLFKHRDHVSPLVQNRMCDTCWAAQRDHWLICGGCHREYNLEGRSDGRYQHYGAYWIRTEGTRMEETEPSTPEARFYCSTCRAPERSKCKPRQPEFDFPALCLGPHESFHAEEIKEVVTGGGDVTATGVTQIRKMINLKTAHGSTGIDLYEIDTDDFDRRWQTHEGNFPKRLAKLLLTERHLKLTEDLMAEIGNIAKQYTSKPGAHRVSLTRNINLPKAEFVNDNSCWWSDYWYSRCTLKSMGGFGIRLWAQQQKLAYHPNTGNVIDEGLKDVAVGRAWMIPLALTLRGTADNSRFGKWMPDAPLPAEAYVVFNGYDGRRSQDRAELLDFARIIAQMTGKSYRKIDFYAPSMYINGTRIGEDGTPKGVLIAEQSVCAENAKVEILTVPNQCSCPGHPAVRLR